MGTFSRLRYVIAANVNALLEKAEDPEKLLRALIREMEDAGEEARAASAELLAEQRHAQRRLEESGAIAGQWHTRAERAVAEGRDDLARAALMARSEAESAGESARRELAALAERITALETDTATLKQKLADAKMKLKTLVGRQRTGTSRVAVTRHPAAPAERRVQRAFGRFDRLQAQVENLEARVQSYETGGPATNAWAATAADPVIEEELERLKQRLAEAAAQPVAAPGSPATAGTE